MATCIRLNSGGNLLRERPDLLQSAANGIADVTRLRGADTQILTGGNSTSDVLASYEQRFYNDSRQQLDLDRYMLALANETDLAGTDTHDFLLTDLDAFAEGTNFVFGNTIFDWRLSAQSVARFLRATNDEILQNSAVRHVARHEYAHIAGMNSTGDYMNPDNRGGLYEGHCANECTLHQVNSVKETFELLDTLSSTRTSGFCLSCIATLRSKR